MLKGMSGALGKFRLGSARFNPKWYDLIMERIIESEIRQPVSYKKTVTLPDEVMNVLGVGPRDNIDG